MTALVATAVLLAGAVIGPLTPREPRLARAAAPDMERPVPTSTVPDPVIPVEVREGPEGPAGRRSRARGVTALRRVATPSPRRAEADVVSGSPVQGGGPVELKLWDGSVVPVAPAQLEGPPGAYRWHLPRDALGWHPDTSDCGAGVTVIGGHISFDGVPGPLARLAAVGPEDSVACVDARGTVHRYAPHDYLVGSLADGASDWRPEGWREGLILYTCTPALDDQLLVVRFRLTNTAGNPGTVAVEE